MNRDKRLNRLGDEHNDTEMLALQAKGYAMKNANPSLIPYADVSTSSNQ